MSAQHTPGPWTIDPIGGRTITAHAFDGSEKWLVDRVRGGSPEEADANTRLIAAAPDLLEALGGVGCCCEFGIGRPGISSHSKVCQAVQDAIAKAGGQA